MNAVNGYNRFLMGYFLAADIFTCKVEHTGVTYESNNSSVTVSMSTCRLPIVHFIIHTFGFSVAFKNVFPVKGLSIE